MNIITYIVAFMFLAFPIIYTAYEITKDRKRPNKQVKQELYDWTKENIR